MWTSLLSTALQPQGSAGWQGGVASANGAGNAGNAGASHGNGHLPASVVQCAQAASSAQGMQGMPSAAHTQGEGGAQAQAQAAASQAAHLPTTPYSHHPQMHGGMLYPGIHQVEDLGFGVWGFGVHAGWGVHAIAQGVHAIAQGASDSLDTPSQQYIGHSFSRSMHQTL
jgi:hypothetical protein